MKNHIMIKLVMGAMCLSQGIAYGNQQIVSAAEEIYVNDGYFRYLAGSNSFFARYQQNKDLFVNVHSNIFNTNSILEFTQRFLTGKMTIGVNRYPNNTRYAAKMDLMSYSNFPTNLGARIFGRNGSEQAVYKHSNSRWTIRNAGILGYSVEDGVSYIDMLATQPAFNPNNRNIVYFENYYFKVKVNRDISNNLGRMLEGENISFPGGGSQRMYTVSINLNSVPSLSDADTHSFDLANKRLVINSTNYKEVDATLNSLYVQPAFKPRYNVSKLGDSLKLPKDESDANQSDTFIASGGQPVDFFMYLPPDVHDSDDSNDPKFIVRSTGNNYAVERVENTNEYRVYRKTNAPWIGALDELVVLDVEFKGYRENASFYVQIKK